MSEWQLLKFKDLFSIPLRNGLTKPSRVRGSGLRMVNMKEIFGYNFIDDKTPMELVPISENERSSMLAFNDLLFARQSLVESGAGKIAIFKGNEPTVFESHLIRCRLDLEKGFADFIYYLFKSSTGRGAVSTIVQQVAAAGIRGSDLQELTFNIPPLPEQKAIAAVLSSLDDKIDLLHRQNKTLEAMAETLFRQWFIEDAKEDWEEVKLGDIASVNSGYNHKREELVESGDYLLSMGSVVKKYGFSLEATRYINTEYISEKYLCQTNDIFLTTRDVTQDAELLGSPGIVPPCIKKKVILGSNLYKLEIKNKKLSIPMVYFLLRSGVYREYVKEVASGTSILMLKKADLDNFFFKIPPILSLNKLDEIFNNILLKLNLNFGQEIKLTKLRDNLLPKLMSGEVRVSYEQQDAA